ncbi:GP46-like surface antigen, putative [Bodo saltans]|uniref:GP46-like surface antigen, putative n=1 Tax=Bodo saltans TaxID=75058 RepID=A0A0S4JSA1_BODSA|nr:GP46-like surface antigen, putative [Bodo saltans]|eukprot:CUG94400.1 GP46-like surface antigen, putative [Bodo saltans]
MTSMVALRCFLNSLSGTLPPEWSSMTQISTLALYINHLSGSLPSEWSPMTGLTNLQLYSNSLSGSLPSAWSSMSSVQLLYLYSNSLSGTLPSSWRNMTSMIDLRLYSNSLSGTLPPEWSSMTQITTLALYSNKLNGSLPSEWSSMSSLQVLYLNINSLSGSLPGPWSSMSSLQVLYLYSNSLSGTPPMLWRNMTSMIDLRLYSNSLSGTLPPEWSSMTQITTLALYSNNLSGSLPTLWSAMSMQVLSLHSNSLSGSLPSAWSSMSSLQVLYLYSNGFSGTLPSLWRNMTGIIDLRLYSNSLSGCLPRSWAGMSNLRQLSLQDNCLSGVVPESFVNLSRLTTFGGLNLCNTKVRGGINVSTCTGGDWPTACYWLVSQSHTLVSLSPTDRRSSRSSTQSPSDPMGTTTASTASHSRTSSRSPSILSKSTTSSIVQCALLPSETIEVLLTPLTDVAELLLTSSLLAVVVSGSSYTWVNSNDTTLHMIGSPIERRVLTSLPYVGLNITLRGPLNTVKYWKVGNVSLPNHQLLSYNAASSNTVTWNAVVLEPPAGGWIGASTPLMTAETFLVNVSMICDDSSMLNVLVTIPAPAVSQEYAQRVETSAGYAQIASIIAGGASSGSALGRVMATRSMVLCNANAAIGGGVADFDLTICGARTDDDDAGTAAVTAGSALVSNVVIILIVIAAALLLSAVWAWFTSKGVRAAICDLCLPSSLLSVWITVVPSCTSSAVFLFARVNRSSCVGVDIVLGVLGLLMSVVPCGASALLWSSRVCGGERAPWVCLVKHENERKYLRQVPRHLHRLLRRRYEWQSTADRSSTSNDMKAAWVVLLEYRELRYCALDACVLCAVSCITVLSGLTGSEAACRGWSMVAVLLMVAQLVVLCAARPFTSIFSTMVAGVTLFLTVLSSLSQLVFLWAFATNTSGLWLVDASAVLSLIVVGVSSTKMALDFYQLIAAIRRRLRTITTASSQNDDHGILRTSSFLTTKPNDFGLRDIVKEIHGSPEVTCPTAFMMTEVDEGIFWDPSGAALGTELVNEHSSDILR